jgi:hypothetical protein
VVTKEYGYLTTFAEKRQARRVKEILTLAGFDVKTSDGEAEGTSDLACAGDAEACRWALERVVNAEREVIAFLRLTRGNPPKD